MFAITASIVTYKNNTDTLKKAIGSFLDTDLPVRLYVIDNSPSDEIGSICDDERIEYVFNNGNIGFGAGHNIAIRRSVRESEYHLVLNPDIHFPRGAAEALYDFMEQNKEIGLVMPKVCYPDGSIQYLCKLLPTPSDFILRRPSLKLLQIIFRDKHDYYCLRHTGYGDIMDVPSLSGCFMFIRGKVFDRIGMFDERFFLHFEDIDFTRRISAFYRTVYYPKAVVFHEKKEDKSLRMLYYMAFSFIKYFNKWGWFFDRERDAINKNTLERLK